MNRQSLMSLGPFFSALGRVFTRRPVSPFHQRRLARARFARVTRLRHCVGRRIGRFGVAMPPPNHDCLLLGTDFAELALDGGLVVRGSGIVGGGAFEWCAFTIGAGGGGRLVHCGADGR